MGYIFDVGEETVWSPSARAGRLYVWLTESFSEMEGCETGLLAVADDMYEIDVPVLHALVTRVYRAFFSSEHSVYPGPLQGWILTSLVLLGRAGITVTPQSPDEEALLAQVSSYEKAMPV